MDAEVMDMDMCCMNDDDDRPIKSTCVTKNFTVSCRKVLNFWVIEFEFKEKSRNYSLSVAFDGYFQRVPCTEDIDPFSEDFTFKPQEQPVLLLLTSSSYNCATDTDYAVLHHKLFNCLFGSDATLLNSDVVVVGLPDGRVFWWPLKKTPSPGCQPHFLCHLEQPVVGILPVSLNAQDDANDCLLFAGQYGKIITCIASNKSHPVFNMEFISNPVTSCCAWKNSLYHSVAGGGLWQNEIQFEQDSISLKARSLRVVGVRAVALESCRNGEPDRNEGILRYTTTDGESRTLDTRSLDDLCPDWINTGGYHTEMIGSLIDALQEASVKLQTVQQRIQLQKRCLDNLTNAFWLIHGDRSNLDVTFSVLKVKGQTNNYVFDIAISGLALDFLHATWHVVCSLSEKDRNDRAEICKSVPIQQDCIRVQLESTVTLKPGHEGLTPVLVLKCGLHLNQTIPNASESDTIYVPLKTFHIDEWHFVTSDSEIGNPKENTTEEIVREIAKSRGYVVPPEALISNPSQQKEGNFSLFVVMTSVSERVQELLENQTLEEAFLKLLLVPIQDFSVPLFCFGYRVRVQSIVDEDVLKVDLKCSDLGCAIKLRSAIANRIQNLLNAEDKLERSGEKSVEVSQELRTFANELLSELRPFDNEDVNAQKMVKMYQKFRNGFSCNLPFL